MIAISTGEPTGAPPGWLVLASVDVEWSKNYRIKDGNVPFCFSVVHVAVPASGRVDPDRPSGMQVRVTSRYVEDARETADLVAAAAEDVDTALRSADVVVGHQLSSDLGVLAASGRSLGLSGDGPRRIEQARSAWHGRRGPRRDPATASVTDTRYDIGHALCRTSRRLVDVCGELNLDVAQPELRGTSMTALHRRWLDDRDEQARERITVLNIRHSLSAALVSLKASGRVRPEQPINVNRLLAVSLSGSLAWPLHPEFAGLVDA